MSLRSRLAVIGTRLSPFYVLWLRQRRACAELRAELAECRRCLAVARSAAAGWEAHAALACDQRRRALALFDAAGEELVEHWSAADDEAHKAYLRSLGERGSL